MHNPVLFVAALLAFYILPILSAPSNRKYEDEVAFHNDFYEYGHWETADMPEVPNKETGGLESFTTQSESHFSVHGFNTETEDKSDYEYHDKPHDNDQHDRQRSIDEFSQNYDWEEDNPDSSEKDWEDETIRVTGQAKVSFEEDIFLTEGQDFNEDDDDNIHLYGQTFVLNGEHPKEGTDESIDGQFRHAMDQADKISIFGQAYVPQGSSLNSEADSEEMLPEDEEREDLLEYNYVRKSDMNHKDGHLEMSGQAFVPNKGDSGSTETITENPLSEKGAQLDMKDTIGISKSIDESENNSDERNISVGDEREDYSKEDVFHPVTSHDKDLGEENFETELDDDVEDNLDFPPSEHASIHSSVEHDLELEYDSSNHEDLADDLLSDNLQEGGRDYPSIHERRDGEDITASKYRAFEFEADMSIQPEDRSYNDFQEMEENNRKEFNEEDYEDDSFDSEGNGDSSFIEAIDHDLSEDIYDFEYQFRHEADDRHRFEVHGQSVIDRERDSASSYVLEVDEYKSGLDGQIAIGDEELRLTGQSVHVPDEDEKSDQDLEDLDFEGRANIDDVQQKNKEESLKLLQESLEALGV